MSDAVASGAAVAGEAASLLWRLWDDRETVPALPPQLRPHTLGDGWAIQRALDELAGPGAGWKIAATSPAGQAHIGADGPLAGRLYARCVRRSGCTLDAQAMTMRVAEAEFAFRMARDLPLGDTPPGRDEVLAATGALLPAVEVPDSRFDDLSVVGLPSMVADGLCCGHLVLGDPIEDWHPHGLAVHVVDLRRNGVVVSRGQGRDVLGDPVDALVWLAGELHAHGLALAAGDVVTTGACTPARPVAPGDDVVADFGALGKVTIHFSDARA
jgi:2-keto-4-pentenoate hydratase